MVPAVSVPERERVPFEHENPCEYAWLPPVTAEEDCTVDEAPEANAGTEYALPLTVAPDAVQPLGGSTVPACEPSVSAPVEDGDFESFMSPATDQEDVG